MKSKVLILPGGYEVGIEIKKSLEKVKNIEVISGSDSSKNPAKFLYKKNIYIPNIENEKKFIKILLYKIKKEKINFIFPSHKYIIDVLNENRRKLKSKIIFSNKKSLDKLKFKTNIYNELKNYSFTSKKYGYLNKIEKMKFPFIVKPNYGFGAQFIKLVSNINDFHLLKKNKEYNNLIFQEYFPGQEYTVDCLSDLKGKLMYCNARTRERIKIGTSFYSADAKKDIQKKCLSIARIISKVLKISGGWFFQVKKDTNKNLKLLEVEPRIAGTMCFSRAKGINIPYLSLLMYQNKKILLPKKNNLEIVSRNLQNNFKFKKINFDVVYIDLDDTLIIENKINSCLISFIYKCINKNKKVILITKSLNKNLKKYLIKKKLFHIFDNIIHIHENEKKYKYIKYKKSIFIDDSFSQRLEVEKKLNIKTFDVTAIESLNNNANFI